jgi:hypothetical protein
MPSQDLLMAPNSTWYAEVAGDKYRLTLNADGLPYILRRYQRNGDRRWAWGIVWAPWHRNMPTGPRKQAIADVGFVWDRLAHPPHWRHLGAESAAHFSTQET